MCRAEFPVCLHHVMARGIDGTDILRDNEDRKAFLSDGSIQCCQTPVISSMSGSS